jgi:hypothetical protein
LCVFRWFVSSHVLRHATGGFWAFVSLYAYNSLLLNCKVELLPFISFIGTQPFIPKGFIKSFSIGSEFLQFFFCYKGGLESVFTVVIVCFFVISYCFGTF